MTTFSFRKRKILGMAVCLALVFTARTVGRG